MEMKCILYFYIGQGYSGKRCGPWASCFLLLVKPSSFHTFKKNILTFAKVMEFPSVLVTGQGTGLNFIKDTLRVHWRSTQQTSMLWTLYLRPFSFYLQYIPPKNRNKRHNTLSYLLTLWIFHRI
jgi:hypothetical protein